MKRIASILLFISVFLGCYAQENTFRFGYLSYDEVLQAMPDYTMVQQKMDAMRQQFQAETAPFGARLQSTRKEAYLPSGSTSQWSTITTMPCQYSPTSTW